MEPKEVDRENDIGGCWLDDLKSGMKLNLVSRVVDADPQFAGRVYEELLQHLD